MGKFKVLQIIGSSGIGGAERAFYSLLKYLDKDKFKIYVACPADGPMFNNFRKYADEIKTFNFKNWALNPSTIFSLKNYMEQKRIDIVHTHLYSADFMGIIAAKLARVPVNLVTVHGHNFSSTGQFDLRSVKNLFCSFIYRAIYMFCDKVITVCQALKYDLIKRLGLKVKEEKIKVIYNGVDLEEVSEYSQVANQELKNISDNNLKFVGVIANFDKVKGHRILLKAIPQVLREVAEAKFLFVGDGEEKERLKQLAERFRIEDSIIFTGHSNNITEIISICKLIVLPSLMEGFPLIILEAMSLGKAVVATKVGGIPELVEEKENGMLVSPNDYEGLAKAIITLLKDEILASEMGRKGKEIVCSKFQAQKMAAETGKLYQALLSAVS